VVPRKARQQRFCSDTCRERARERSRKAFLGCDTGAPTNPPKKLNGFNRYGGSESRSSLAHNAVQTEFFGGRTWRTVASSDGIVSAVSSWRPRTLQDSHQTRQQHGVIPARAVTVYQRRNGRGPDTTPKEMSSPPNMENHHG
jgi:hypothetical protein